MDLANPVPLALTVLGVSCIVSGIFFMGYDTDPIEKVAVTVAIHQLLTGIIMLFISATVILTGNSLGNGTVSTWVATILGFFGMLWLSLALVGLKGGDFKMLSWILLIGAILSVFYTYTSSVLHNIDFVILFILVLAGTFLGFLGLLGIPAVAAKVAGFVFVLLGIDCLYVVIKSLMPITKLAG